MPVLSRDALEGSPLADLHLIASELGLDGFRRLRKADLVDAILVKAGMDDAPAALLVRAGGAAPPAAAEEGGDEEPKRRTRSRGGRSRRSRDADGDADAD